LEADRLVDVIPNRGAVVKKLTQHEIRQLFQIREALEGQAARLAALHIGIADNRTVFSAVLEHSRRHWRQPVFTEFVVDNRAFHQEIVRLSGNPLLGELIDRYQLPVFMIQLRQQIGSEQMIRNAMAEHDAIAEAILAGDGDAAYNAMKRHLNHSATLILSLPTLARPLDNVFNDSGQ
jgi:DNA-binding GntR family transcriptional regulator